jgi:hypothetical protein
MLSPFISRRDKFGSDNWTPNDLIREFHAFAAARRDEDDSMDLRNSVGALEWRIQQLQRSAQILDDTRHLDLRMLFQPGQCTVLQLDEVDRREQQVVVAVLLRRLYQARQRGGIVDSAMRQDHGKAECSQRRECGGGRTGPERRYRFAKNCNARRIRSSIGNTFPAGRLAIAA